MERAARPRSQEIEAVDGMVKVEVWVDGRRLYASRIVGALERAFR